LDQLTDKRASGLWMGRYSIEQVRKAIEASSIRRDLQRKGLDDLVIQIRQLEDFDQALMVYHREVDPDRLLAEMRLREVQFKPQPRLRETFSTEPVIFLAIDWLLMQNPYADFTPERPALPGQAHPGLGVARKVLKLMIAHCLRNKIPGITNFPEYFHNAYLYRSHFRFYDPQAEGILYALYRDLTPQSISYMSWAIEFGCVRDVRADCYFEWQSSVQILPIQKKIARYFESSWYVKRQKAVFREARFELDRKKFDKIMASRSPLNPAKTVTPND
jgi:ribosomal protein S21